MERRSSPKPRLRARVVAGCGGLLLSRCRLRRPPAATLPPLGPRSPPAPCGPSTPAVPHRPILATSWNGGSAWVRPPRKLPTALPLPLSYTTTLSNAMLLMALALSRGDVLDLVDDHESRGLVRVGAGRLDDLAEALRHLGEYLHATLGLAGKLGPDGLALPLRRRALRAASRLPPRCGCGRARSPPARRCWRIPGPVAVGAGHLRLALGAVALLLGSGVLDRFGGVASPSRFRLGFPQIGLRRRLDRLGVILAGHGAAFASATRTRCSCTASADPTAPSRSCCATSTLALLMASAAARWPSASM